MSILPHGGRLVNRLLDGERAAEEARRANGLPQVELEFYSACDLFMIACGAYSPLEGFMTQDQYRRVLAEKRVAPGIPWTIPITLGVEPTRKGELRPGQEIALTAGGKPVAILHLTDVYRREVEAEVQEVYGTSDASHPGVGALLLQGSLLLGGPVEVVRPTLLSEHFRLGYKDYMNTPRQTREYFSIKGWQTVVGFQTRNPIHRAHEYLIKSAMETTDGALIHPLVGPTKKEDVPVDVRMRCYEAILTRYFPTERVALAIMPTAMRYAGPMEAVHHAIVRKNYGCTHFIIGRDHAGVGSFYGSYDAQKIFSHFDPIEIGIVPLRFEHSFYCRRCDGMASYKTCPHPDSDHLVLSGTKMREMLARGEELPPQFTRPEVAAILRDAYRGQHDGAAGS